MKKRTLCLLLSWVMALSLLPFGANAAEQNVCVGWTFRESVPEHAAIRTSDPDKVTLRYVGKTVVHHEWVHDDIYSDYDITVSEPGTYELQIVLPGDEDNNEEIQTVTIAAKEHAWREWEQETAPTCTEDGYETRTCANDTSHVQGRPIAATGHSWGDWEVTKAPTCTEKGVESRTCRNDAAHIETRSTAPLGHAWSDWEEVLAPTIEKQGVSVRSCTVCGGTDLRSIPKLKPEPTPAPTATPTPTPAPEPTATPKLKFKDVKKDAYCYDAVVWAVNHDPVVTTGTDESHFSPSKDCTRAQTVTFLWRAAGEPEPAGKKNPFGDVKKGSYYYDAVLWAVGEGITTGTGENTFSPDAKVTRAQTVTFLWRMADEPAVKAKNPFQDVSKNAYYYDAVLWAVKNEITNGKTANTFAPNDPCTRAQIVTFLYRDLG